MITTTPTPEQILVVDDEEPVLRSLDRILRNAGYATATAGSVAVARRLLDEQAFDLLLSDVNMPEEDGLDLVRHARAAAPDTAVVMVTGVDDTGVARRALEHGAYGYVIKPFERNEILINVTNALQRRALEIENRAHREQLERLVHVRTAQLRSAHEEAIWRLAHVVEYRDETTGSHLHRMSAYSALLARRAGIDDERAATIGLAALLHDIGKIGVPDDVLGKRGPLDEDEWVVMRRHPTIGREILDGSSSELLRVAADIAFTHHEWFDGRGYPRGVAGTAIPVEGRIVAIADVFDALTTSRPYKQAFPMERAFEMLVEERGSHFDPELVDLFVAARDEVLAVAATYRD
jgi:putative two-component system response regulator